MFSTPLFKSPNRLVSVPSRLASALINFSTSSKLTVDFTHAVVGGGVVGLAIARQLQLRSSRLSDTSSSVILLEKHETFGTETSSRNSEVIHAGIYYPDSSLKTKLCIRGKELIYSTCKKYSIPYANTGKWIIAQTEQQLEKLAQIHNHANHLTVPTEFIPLHHASNREQSVHVNTGVLSSPSTGIIDSHSFMQYLYSDFINAGGCCSFNSQVHSLEPLNSGHDGWHIHVESLPTSSTPSSMTTLSVENWINAAGLSAISLSNSLFPPNQRIEPAYSKGTYYTYQAPFPPSFKKPHTLIYPVPDNRHSGLGTHLTLDLAGDIRFGPDEQWVDNPNDYSLPSNPPCATVQEYLPTLNLTRQILVPTFCGIRPKLAKYASNSTGPNFRDFYVKQESLYANWINLLGIESPGLTSSLALAEYVESLIYGPQISDVLPPLPSS